MVLLLMLRLQKSEIEFMGKLLIEMCEFHDYKLQFNKTLLWEFNNLNDLENS